MSLLSVSTRTADTGSCRRRTGRLLRIAVTVLLMIVSCRIALAQIPGDTVVSIVSVYPGSEIYELEGHTLLRVTAPGTDFAVSYGTFDFDSPNFVYRFVKGETDYMMSVIPWPYLREEYTAQGRRMVERRLNLSPEQKEMLFGLIQENYLPENRTYRYNYILDNCATRPLDLVGKAIGDSIVPGNPADNVSDARTWREMLHRYHTNYPWYSFGVDLALGSGIDIPVSNRDRCFAPAALDTRLEGATAGGRKLVSATTVINDVPADNAVLGPTPWFLTPMAVFSLFLILTVIVTVRDWRNRRPSRAFDGIFFGLLGLVSCVMMFLVFVSTHFATSPNWLLLWFSPLCVIIAVAEWTKRAQKLLLWLQTANFAVVLAGMLLWPFLRQSTDAAVFPLVAAELIRSALYPALALISARAKRKNSDR